MRYDLVIFDFDGTLADSEPWFFEIIGEIADQHGFKVPDTAGIEVMRGLPSREILRRLGIPMWKMPAIATHMRKLAAEAASAGRIPLFPGVAELIRSIDEAGARLAIVSSNAEPTIRTVLGPELANRIDDYDCGASMFGKPRKMRQVIARSGVPAARVLTVGDEGRDIEAARDVRVASAAVLWGYSDRRAFENPAPDALVETPEALSRFLAGAI